MTRLDKITAVAPLDGKTAPAPSVPISGVGATLHTADASKVSGRDFLDALGLSSPEIREARREQTRQQCIRAIRRGDTYGFPPVLVAECREQLAEVFGPKPLDDGSWRVEL